MALDADARFPCDVPMSPTAQTNHLSIVNRRRGGPLGLMARGLAVVLVVLGVGVGVGAFALYTSFASGLPALDQFDDMSRSSVTRFESADGQLAAEWYEERRVAVGWGQLPRHLILAFLAAEDARFFEHSGIDLKGIARAMVANIQAGSTKEGASTITQQLAKQLVGAKRSYERKVREAILARRMEDLYSKRQILTWYLNAIYLGHGSYGVQAAAQNYFRKNLWELSLAEMAMLGGLAQRPSRVNPAVDLPASRRRMAHVLKNMRERGWISAADEARALDTKLVIWPLRDKLGSGTPYYTAHVREQIASRYEKSSWLDKGLTVSMRVDPAMQRVASDALAKALEGVAKKQGFPGALGRMERAVFFTRNADWVRAEKGARVLARVASVEKKKATVEMSAALRGTLTLETTRWAAPYTEFPVRRGRRDHKATASFKGRLKDLRKALAVGDIVLVELQKAASSKAPVPVELVPVPLMEGAIASYGHVTGGLDAMVGGWDFDRSEVNRAFAVRQTGSTMKPIVYSKAYDIGLPPSAVFSGAPFREGEYNPTGTRTKEDMLVWQALAKSENSVSLRVLQYVLNHTSIEAYKQWGKTLGLARPLTGYTSEILGADQTPLSMVHAFGHFARGGHAPDMHTVRKVTDRDGNVLERNLASTDPHAGFADTLIALWRESQEPEKQVISAQVSYLIARNLTRVVAEGTGWRAKTLGREAAGKTGTLPYDVWFVGFTAERSAVSWIGADLRRRTLGPSFKSNKVYGGDTALPAWIDFMKRADVGRAGRPVGGAEPPGLVRRKIDPATGMLARQGGVEIPHVAGTEPTQYPPEELDVDRVDDLETEF